MDATAFDLLQRLGEEGPRRFSGWNASRFGAYCQSVLPALWDQLPPGGDRTFDGYARLIQQGLGEGYLKGDPGTAPLNFLEFCLRDWLPSTLAGLPVDEHLPLLARIWNLGEGLFREPEWVNAYVMSRIGLLSSVSRPESFLVEVLRPLMEPSPTARWEAPYRVSLLSLRQADEEILPGELHLAAPSVLIVTDRLRPVRLGVHLRREGQSRILGNFGEADAFPDEPAAMSVTWEEGTARIGDELVSLPFLGGPYRWALVNAGYLVATAVDSQKLWIVESVA